MHLRPLLTLGLATLLAGTDISAQEALPKPSPPFAGKITETYKDSKSASFDVAPNAKNSAVNERTKDAEHAVADEVE